MNPANFVAYILSLQPDDPLQLFQFHFTLCNTMTVLEVRYHRNPNFLNAETSYLLVGRLFATEEIMDQIMPHIISLSNATLSFNV